MAALQLVGDRPRVAMPMCKPYDHPSQHGVFPAMKMSGTSPVDHQPVRRIGGRRLA